MVSKRLDWKEQLWQEIHLVEQSCENFTMVHDDIKLLEESAKQFCLYIYVNWPSLEECQTVSQFKNIMMVQIEMLLDEPPEQYEVGLQALACLPNVIAFTTDRVVSAHAFNIPMGYPNLKLLSLRNCALTQLPENIENCKELLYFEIWSGSGTDFSQVGNDFERLNGCSKLRYLDLNQTKLKEFPEALTQHPSLEELNLDDNEIAELPESIGQMKQLKELIVGGVIPRIPDSIGDLSQLRKLEISTECASSLPDSIGKLTQLQDLSIYSELVTDIPESIVNLSQLKKLKISGKIKNLPEWLCQMMSLEDIDFSYNQIQDVSWDIGLLRHLPNLRTLSLTDNPLTEECKSRIHQAFPSNTKPGVYLDMTDYY